MSSTLLRISRPSPAARSAALRGICAFGLVAGLVALSACEIQRVSQGVRLRADPHEWIVDGVTRKGDVLRIFGPPTEIQRQLDGDVFTYSYMLKDERSFSLEAPRTDLGISYKQVDERHDRLVVLFDKQGLVSGFGYSADTEQMPGIASLRPLKPVVREAVRPVALGPAQERDAELDAALPAPVDPAATATAKR
jgi:hypothetical protein